MESDIHDRSDRSDTHTEDEDDEAYPIPPVEVLRPNRAPIQHRRTKHLTRDQKLRVLHWKELHLTQGEIVRRTGYTKGQVRRAFNNPPTPKKRTGRPPVLTAA